MGAGQRITASRDIQNSGAADQRYRSQHQARSMTYRITIQPLSPEDGGGYLARVPELPGCMSDGETVEEARANVMDAIVAWLEADRKRRA